MQGFMEKLNFDIESVVDFMMAVIFASTHSTSLTFTQCLFGTYIIYNLFNSFKFISLNHLKPILNEILSLDYINHPEYHKELLEEAERVYKKNKHLPYYEINTPNQMKKLDNFIKESFRVHRLPGKKMSI